MKNSPQKKTITNQKEKSKNVYCPKKVKILNKNLSQKKINTKKNKLILNQIKPQKNYENNLCRSPNITYSKKRIIDYLQEQSYARLNRSVGEIKHNLNNQNNFSNNINSFDISSLPDLNSSMENSNNLKLNSGTSKKLYNYSSTTNSGNITNSSNMYHKINNMYPLIEFSDLNADNDLMNISNINYNNSFYDSIKPNSYDFNLNSSYNIGYKNPLENNSIINKVNLSNMVSNNYIGLNPLMMSNNFNEYIMQKNNFVINIEDLLILEEKYHNIIHALNKGKMTNNECFDCWNYYFECSLNGILEQTFPNKIYSNNVQISIKYLLLTILICYDCSFDIYVLGEVNSNLKELLNLNHQNLILIYEHIFSKISDDNKNNNWVDKLSKLIKSSKKDDDDFNYNDCNNKFNDYPITIIDKINFNTEIIIQNIRVLLKNFKTPKVDYLISLFKKINDKTYEDINLFYQLFIYNIDNINGSIFSSIFFKQNPNFFWKPMIYPYVNTINHKQYTLILDLNETLIHFKPSNQNFREGVLRIRPGLTEFLDDVGKLYELILFTGSEESYANLLIDAIEDNKIYFEHRLYRQHLMVIGNEYVKDLSKIGRPLDKMIIVDNMPQNFKLQKENGIYIKSFWGEDKYDSALINLSNILINIAKEGGDVREGLEKYKNQIVEKISCSMRKEEKKILY